MPDISREEIDIVDSKDEVIGQDTLLNVYKNGAWHRAAHVWVLDSAGKLYLQERGRSALLFPLHWSNSVGEHLNAGESYEQAALRGLKEELGVEGVVLEKLVKKKFTMKKDGDYYNRVFITLFKCNYDGKIAINKHELETGGFYGIGEIKNAIKKKSMKFSPVFLEFFNWYVKNKKGK